MNTQKRTFAWLLVVALMLVALPQSALAFTLHIPTISNAALVGVASDLPNSLEWDGQGSDSLRCDKLGESPERTEDGWIHWIVTQASDITEAELELGGSGSGTYDPNKYGPVVEFFTPYFDVETLTATLHYAGALGNNTQFVISDYCPGGDVEALDVSKTVETSYTRTHDWDVAKKVETENGYELDDFPKIWLYTDGSGDETATWTVDVTYMGYEDDDHNVSGDITIENVGTLDAVITAVDDVLGGTPIDVDCGVTFPYTLPVGETLTCTYDEDDYFEGDNVVTVTTESGGEYDATEPIIWGDPDEEFYATITVTDTNPGFAAKYGDPVTLDAADYNEGDVETFTYEQEFAYADYEECGSFEYDNTATIVELDKSASATLKVNVQCFVYETAFAKGDDATCFIDDGFSRWGWTNPISADNDYTMDLWAAAGQCDTSKGTLVGTVSVEHDAAGFVTVIYNVDAGFLLDETHVYAGEDKYPKDNRGRVHNPVQNDQ